MQLWKQKRNFLFKLESHPPPKKRIFTAIAWMRKTHESMNFATTSKSTWRTGSLLSDLSVCVINEGQVQALSERYLLSCYQWLTGPNSRVVLLCNLTRSRCLMFSLHVEPNVLRAVLREPDALKSLRLSVELPTRASTMLSPDTMVCFRPRSCKRRVNVSHPVVILTMEWPWSVSLQWFGDPPPHFPATQSTWLATHATSTLTQRP